MSTDPSTSPAETAPGSHPDTAAAPEQRPDQRPEPAPAPERPPAAPHPERSRPSLGEWIGTKIGADWAAVIVAAVLVLLAVSGVLPAIPFLVK